MAVQQTIRFGDIALQIGDGATPTEAFATWCGFTSISRQYSIQTQTEDLPDCDDPDAVGFESPVKISVGEEIQFQGFVDPENTEALGDLAYDEDDTNIRLVYNRGSRVGYFQGPAILTAGQESYDRRQSGKITGTLKFTAKPTWTAT